MEGRAQPEVWGLSLAEWQAIGVVGTAAAFLVAAIAAGIAAGQLRQARRARLDQARPYVMLSAEASTQNFSDINLRLENVGAGPAYDVHIDVSPPFVRVREVEEVPLSKARIFAKPIPMLPPNFSLVTWFDSAIERNNASMPAQHDVRIRYHDGHGHKWDERQVVDVNYLNDLLFTETYGVHHIAKSLRDIEKLLKKQVTHLENPIAVTTEARAEYEDRVRERNTARRRQLEQMQQDWRERQADAEVTDEADSANP